MQQTSVVSGGNAPSPVARVAVWGSQLLGGSVWPLHLWQWELILVELFISAIFLVFVASVYEIFQTWHFTFFLDQDQILFGGIKVMKDICGQQVWKLPLPPWSFNPLAFTKNDAWKTTYFPIGFRSVFRGKLLNFRGVTLLFLFHPHSSWSLRHFVSGAGGEMQSLSAVLWVRMNPAVGPFFLGGFLKTSWWFQSCPTIWKLY